RDNHLVAWTAGGCQGRGNRVLGAVRDNDLVGAAAQAVGFLVMSSDGRAQLRDAVCRRVVRMAVLHGFEGGPANVFGREEIRLAQTEIEYLDPFGLQLPCLRSRGQSGRRLDAGG